MVSGNFNTVKSAHALHTQLPKAEFDDLVGVAVDGDPPVVGDADRVVGTGDGRTAVVIEQLGGTSEVMA